MLVVLAIISCCMKRLLLALLLVWSIAGVGTAQQLVGQMDLAKLDAYVEQARQNWHIPGMAIAVIKDGKVVMAKGYGLRDVKSKKPVDENSLFAIASNSKAFTVAALSQQVAAGKLKWDDPVQKYLPWFQLSDPWISAHITVRDAVCHNSGLGTFSGDLLWYETTYTTREVLERARYLTPEFDFRAGYGYSNLMFSAAGMVLESVTGRSWQEYIQTEFFKPLGMKNSNTSVKDFTPQSNVALPHAVHADGTADIIDYLNWDNAPAAAAINSSVADMAQWIIMQLNNGDYNGAQLLNPKQMAYARRLHNPTDVRGSMRGKTSFQGYGLGWDIYDYYGHLVINHGGGSDGMISKVLMVPDEQFGFVILTNSINYLPSALSYWILDSYLGKSANDYSAMYLDYKTSGEQREAKAYEEAKAARNLKSKPDLPLEAYTGLYGGELYGDARVTIENGHLVLDFLPAPKLIGDLSHWQYNTFEIELRHTPLLPKGKVRFIIGMDGEVEELKVDIPNPDFFFTELKFTKKPQR